MLTEEPFITINQLLDRWPGMNTSKIEHEVNELWLPVDDSPGMIFPCPSLRIGQERLNPNTGTIVWDIGPLDMPLDTSCYHGNCILGGSCNQKRILEGSCGKAKTFKRLCFKLGDIETYEKKCPEVFYPLVDADTLEMKTPAAETEVPGAVEDSAKLRAQLAKVMAEYGARLAQAEAGLSKTKAALAQAEEAAKRKRTDAATMTRLKNTVEAWQGAADWMVPAAVAVALDGPKARTRPELWAFVEAAGGPKRPANDGRNEQFEAWRAALPDDFRHIGNSKESRDGQPQIDVESLEG